MRNEHPIENPATAEWDVSLTYAEYTKLLKGFTPRDMDDKWVIFADLPDASGNTTIRFARSWTGREQISVYLIAGDPSRTDVDTWAKIVTIMWEKRDEPGAFLSTEEEAKEVARVLYTDYILHLDEQTY